MTKVQGKWGMMRVVMPAMKVGEKERDRPVVQLINGTDLKRVDRLLVLQHFIRRFKSHHEEDFILIATLRHEIDATLGNVVQEDEPERAARNHIALLECCMDFAWSRDNRNLLLTDQLPAVIERLRGELYKAIDNGRNFLLHFFADGDLAKLVQVIKKLAHALEKICQRVNYFQYYSPFELTSYVAGKKLYEIGIKARRGIHKICSFPYAIDWQKVDDHSWWLYTYESNTDREIYAAIATTRHKETSFSKNINIFGGRQHHVSVNGKLLENRLVLSVPIDETPDNIDQALQVFRHALLQELVHNAGMYFFVSRPDFDNSIFMSAFAHATCLMPTWKQLQKSLVGLWAWDLAKLEGRAVERACNTIVDEMQEFKKNLPHALDVYKFKTVNTAYKTAAEQIGPPPRDNAAIPPRGIDKFLTCSDIALGSVGGRVEIM